MRILILTHYYPPEVNAPASRLSEHARAWVQAGDDVTVVTCAPNHPHGRLFPGFKNRLWQEETVDGVRVIRLWTWLSANAGVVGRFANFLSYFLAVLLWSWRVPKADVVLSTSPQFFCGLAGLIFQRRNCPWVLEIRDIWPEAVVTVGAMRKGLLIRLLEGLESFAYRRADLVVSVTDSFVPHIQERRRDKPIVVVKNGVNLTLFNGRQPDAAAAFRNTHDLSDKFVAAYVGTHGMAHGLDTLIQAAEILRDRDDIVLLLIGDGAEGQRLRASLEARNLRNIRMLGLQPRSAMPSIWSACDVALVPLRKLDLFTGVIPSKMFEAMAMSCPIILGVEGEAKALLEESGSGIAVPPEDPQQLADAMVQLADDPARRAHIGAAARNFVTREFDRHKLAMRLRSALDTLVS